MYVALLQQRNMSSLHLFHHAQGCRQQANEARLHATLAGDLKVENVLLKSQGGDARLFTCKLGE